MDTQNIAFWQQKYVNNETGWDVGAVSTPLKVYFNQLENKSLKILIAGAGNAYEAEYLHKQGFRNVHILDWAQEALDNLSKRVSSFPKNHLHQVDFFEHQDKYDLIIEQTFFCAINPNLRPQYVEKMHSLLKENGKLVGLLFNIPLHTDKPPFGGSKNEYKGLFSKRFNLKIMETAYNSITPRKENELFILFEKKTI